MRPFGLRDLDAAARFAEAARARDPAVEPFGQSLSSIATGPRAALDVWRVAAGDDGGLYGLAFAGVRDAAGSRVLDFYVVVHPALRRQGLGRALSEAAVSSGATLRARVRDDASAGRAFLAALGFEPAGAQLSLQWNGAAIEARPVRGLRVRKAGPRDLNLLEALTAAAWEDAPDAFLSGAAEIATLFSTPGRLVLLAESEGQAIGYLSGVQLGRTLAIEEVAVVPEQRRRGTARALVTHAVSGAEGAMLSVSDANVAARGLYRTLGFRQVARRVVLELRRG